MASSEGIRSRFPTQPGAARSRKLRIYETLFFLNQSVDQVAKTLRNMMKFPFAPKDSLRHAYDELEELRAGVNADFIEELSDRERSDEGRFWQQRRAFEKKWRDPDDVYIDVKRREQERKKQGLPSRVGIIPHSAVAEQQERWRPQQQRKRNRRRIRNPK